MFNKIFMIQQKLLADIRRKANSNIDQLIYVITKVLFSWIIPLGIVYGYSLFMYVGAPLYYYPMTVVGIIFYIYARKYYFKVSNANNQPKELLKLLQKRLPFTNFDEQHLRLSNQAFISNAQINPNKKIPHQHFCEICKIECPYRTRHCRQCNMCTLQFDHHCKWLGNCIGKRNKRQFFLLLLTQFVVCWIGIYFGYYTKNRVSGFIWYTIQPLLRILTLFGIFTGYLLVLNVLLISKGWGYWEYMRKNKISYLQHLNKGYNPFSKGIKGNWIYLFNPDPQQNCWNIPNTDQAKLLYNQEVDLFQNRFYDCCP